ncbi:hypothetical protein OC861_003639 [Tilletia horrida]|nr:hypothetical protein OC861_003639 [Tilletia horrida]
MPSGEPSPQSQSISTSPTHEESSAEFAEGQPATQASIVNDLLEAANGEVAAEEEGNSGRKAGRNEGSLSWSGPELRALIISMKAHNVFDPSLFADDRSQAWLDVVRDLNRWNREHPRKGGKYAVRTVDGCDNKWRKSLYKAIKAGEAASQIASGPSEEEDEFMDACQHLKDQWEQGIRDEQVKREAKRKAKHSAPEKALDARQRATDAIAKGMETVKQGKREQKRKRERAGREEGEQGSGDDVDDDGDGTGSEDDSGKSKGKPAAKTARRIRGRASDAASAELTAAVAGMASQQVDEARMLREQQQQQHEERLQQEDKAREIARQHHKDIMARDHRALDLQEQALSQKTQDGERVALLEEHVKQLSAKHDELFSFLKTRLA